MNDLIDYIKQHPLVVWGMFVSTCTWIFNNLATRVISALPAPGKNATEKYIFWFKFFNRLVGNSARAENTAIEQSPNWQDAINKHIANLQNNNVSNDARQ